MKKIAVIGYGALGKNFVKAAESVLTMQGKKWYYFLYIVLLFREFLNKYKLKIPSKYSVILLPLRGVK